MTDEEYELLKREQYPIKLDIAERVCDELNTYCAKYDMPGFHVEPDPDTDYFDVMPDRQKSMISGALLEILAKFVDVNAVAYPHVLAKRGENGLPCLYIAIF